MPKAKRKLTKIEKVRYSLVLHRADLKKLEFNRWATGIPVSAQIRMAIDDWLSGNGKSGAKVKAYTHTLLSQLPTQA